jgi:mono/diheme cytochrome c family protein
MRGAAMAAIALAAFGAGALGARTPAGAFANADAQAGKALHDKDCVACHARRFDGDASRMYTRPDRRVHTVAQLRAQVAVCNSQLGTRYFPDDEENVAAFLDREYYRLEP